MTGQGLLSVLRAGAVRAITITLTDLSRVCMRILIFLNLLFLVLSLSLASILVASLFETERYGGRVGALCLRFKYRLLSWRYRVLIMEF